jgi:hypothetical protein
MPSLRNCGAHCSMRKRCPGTRACEYGVIASARIIVATSTAASLEQPELLQLFQRPAGAVHTALLEYPRC